MTSTPHVFPRGYPTAPKTVGEHLRKRRIDLGLRQRDLAGQWALRTETVAGWERGLLKPSIRSWPRVIVFLGFDPNGAGDSPGERLEAARRRLGLTRRELAAKVGLDEGSICRWARGGRQPSPWMAARTESILQDLDGLHPRSTARPTYFDLSRWRRTPPTGSKPRTLGERIRERRLELGLSQAQLGRLFGVGRATIYRWESGKAPPPRRVRNELMGWLGGRSRDTRPNVRRARPARLDPRA